MQCSKVSTRDTAVNKIKMIPNSQEFMGSWRHWPGVPSTAVSQLSLNKSALTDQVKQDSMFGNHCYKAICLEAIKAKESKEEQS